MKKISTKQISRLITKMCKEVNSHLDNNIIQKLQEEKNKNKIVKIMLENIFLAKKELLPICQDTGTVVIFAEIGQEVHIVGGGFEQAIQEGVAKGYKNFRKSIVAKPLFERINTQTNLPSIIHSKIVAGDKITFNLLAKGGGAENKSALKMFNPTDNSSKIEDFILQTIKEAGAMACPPYIVGVGIGGNFEQCALLAKKSLLRPLGQSNKDAKFAEMEKNIQKKANCLNIGPMGFGGELTLLSVNIDFAPVHIASLPVAVNISCYINRHKKGEL